MKLFCSQTDKSGCHMTSLAEVIGDRQWLWGKCGFCWRTASQVCPQSLSNPKDIMFRRLTNVLLGHLQSGLLWRNQPWTDQQPWEAMLLEWQRPLSSKLFINYINSKIRKWKQTSQLALSCFLFSYWKWKGSCLTVFPVSPTAAILAPVSDGVSSPLDEVRM